MLVAPPLELLAEPEPELLGKLIDVPPPVEGVLPLPDELPAPPVPAVGNEPAPPVDGETLLAVGFPVEGDPVPPEFPPPPMLPPTPPPPLAPPPLAPPPAIPLGMPIMLAADPLSICWRPLVSKGW